MVLSLWILWSCGVKISRKGVIRNKTGPVLLPLTIGTGNRDYLLPVPKAVLRLIRLEILTGKIVGHLRELLLCHNFTS